MTPVSPYAVRRVAGPADAIRYWPMVKGWVMEAANKCDSLMGELDIERGLRSGAYQLWMIFHDAVAVAAFVTEVWGGQMGSALNVLSLGGADAVSAMGEFTAALRAYAKSRGCRLVVEMGREGWTRVLKKHGWEKGPAVMILAV